MALSSSLLFFCVCVWHIHASSCQTEQLKICAFNVQIFGESKFSKPEVVATLSQIVRRYDVTLIQEIRDSSETIIHSFLDIVNRDSLNEGVVYALNVSERLGRTSSKEQYAFLYRVDKVEVTAVHQYQDPQDLFQREPYSVLLTTKTINLPKFFLMGIHTQPSAAFDEINALVQVYNELVTTFETTNGVILGDLNADCGSLSQTRYNMLDLLTDSRFQWLIDSTADTTTNTNDCSYDRIIVAGGVANIVVNNSAQVFRFDEAYGLTFEQTLDVSDHYPVEFSVEGESTSSLAGRAQGLSLIHLTFIISMTVFYNLYIF